MNEYASTQHARTQCDIIKSHLENVGPITSWEAMRDYGCMRLASRISDLKKLGVEIDSRMVSSTNRFGDKIHYKEYFLEDKQDSPEVSC